MYSEQKIKTTLAKLTANWNPLFWLFAADSGLYLMRKHPDGTRVVNPDGSMAQSAIVYKAEIDADGGDW